MLHTETVEGTTLELLRRLQSESMLDSFCLAGEIALALYLGHRKSIDLDLFTPYPFDVLLLKDFLETKYGFRTDFLEKNTLKGSINGVKIDCITHAYERLGNPCMEDGIRLYALEDIVAMKLSAIADNDSRLKDFIDIAFLSTRLSFYSMLKCYEHKFPKSNVIRPILRGRDIKKYGYEFADQYIIATFPSRKYNIDEYFKTYKTLKNYLDNLVKSAKENGYTKTIYGRRRPVPELSSGNFMQRQFGERIAMNSPLQGTAADIIKIAMINVYKRLKNERLESRLILQIHDELLIETKIGEEEQVREILSEEMVNAATLRVPLAIDIHSGKDWYEAK